MIRDVYIHGKGKSFAEAAKAPVSHTTMMSDRHVRSINNIYASAESRK